MFGYVKISEDELRVREWKLYKSCYCGLCRQIAMYSQAARAMLSYDMVCIALILGARPETDLAKYTKKLLLRHCKKACGDKQMEYVAAVSIMFQHYKLQNDLLDGEQNKKLLLLAIERGFRKAVNDYPIINERIAGGMLELNQLEKKKCVDFETLERCFASVFTDVCACDPSADEYADIKGKMAYHIASWVYWFDMLLDMNKDRDSHDFNAILLQSSESEGRLRVLRSLNEHLEKAEWLCGHLPFSDGTAILSNIICVGLPAQLEAYVRKHQQQGAAAHEVP